MNKVILIGIIVCIVVAIAIGIFFGVKDLTKKSSDDGEERPDLQFNKASKTLQPQEGKGEDDSDPSDSVVDIKEGYQIEYETGTNESGNKSVDITVSWKNGTGFNKVDKLIFRREVDGAAVQEDIVVDSGSGIANNGSGSITFKGEELTDPTKSIIGANKISAWFNEVKGENLLADTGEDIKVTQEDLDTTIDLTVAEVVDVPITLDKDSFKAEKLSKETLYEFRPFHQYFKMKQLGGGKVQFINLLSGNVDNLWGTADSFKLRKYKDGFMLGHPEDGNKVLVRRVLKQEDINWGSRGINHRPEWKTLKNMNKSDYERAKFDLIPARTGLKATDGTVVMNKTRNNDACWSPNKKFHFKVDSDGKLTLTYNRGTASDPKWYNIWKHTIKDIPQESREKQEFQINEIGNCQTGVRSNEYNSRTSGWGDNAPYRLVVADDGTVALIKSDGRVIHYITRFRSECIACQGVNGPKDYKWTRDAPGKNWGGGGRFNDDNLAVVHHRWLQPDDGNRIYLEGDVSSARKEGYWWVASTIAQGKVGHKYYVFGLQSPNGRDYVYLPDGSCTFQSNSVEDRHSAELTGIKPDYEGPIKYKGSEAHDRFNGFTTWRIDYIPTLPLPGWKNENHESIGGRNEPNAILGGGINECVSRVSTKYKDAALIGFRSPHKNSGNWANTCFYNKIGSPNFSDALHNRGSAKATSRMKCADPLKSIISGCVAPLMSMEHLNRCDDSRQCKNSHPHCCI